MVVKNSIQVEYNKLIETYKLLSKRLNTDRQESNDYDRLVDLREEIDELEKSGVVTRSDSPTQILPLEDIDDCSATPPCASCRVVLYK